MRDFVPISTEFGIVVRRNALGERGVTRDKLLDAMQLLAPVGENEDLVSFGPIFGPEAASALMRALENCGFVYVDDFVMLQMDTPPWLQMGARVVA